jgi:hypothetical protein
MAPGLPLSTMKRFTVEREPAAVSAAIAPKVEQQSDVGSIAGLRLYYQVRGTDGLMLDYPPHLSTGLELLGLMTRTVSASLTLPIGMARCRTPSEAWSEQNKFLQGLATDCRTVTLRMMNAAFNAFPEQDPQAKSKKRQQAHLQR